MDGVDQVEPYGVHFVLEGREFLPVPGLGEFPVPVVEDTFEVDPETDRDGRLDRSDMVLEILVEVLQPGGSDGVAVHLQEEGEYFQQVVMDYAPERQPVDVAGVPILEEQGLPQFVQVLAVCEREVPSVNLYHSAQGRHDNLHFGVYQGSGCDFAVQEPLEGLKHREDAVDRREQFDYLFGGDVRKGQVESGLEVLLRPRGVESFQEGLPHVGHRQGVRRLEAPLLHFEPGGHPRSLKLRILDRTGLDVDLGVEVGGEDQQAAAGS